MPVTFSCRYLIDTQYLNRLWSPPWLQVSSSVRFVYFSNQSVRDFLLVTNYSTTTLVTLVVNVLLVAFRNTASKFHERKTLSERFTTVSTLELPSRQEQIHGATKAREISERSRLRCMSARRPDPATRAYGGVPIELHGDFESVDLLPISGHLNRRNVDEVGKFSQCHDVHSSLRARQKIIQ